MSEQAGAKPAAKDPMRLWNRVSKTDPKMAKEASNGRFKFTTVDQQWQLEQATKQWGPYGAKWGLFGLVFSEMRTDPPSMMLTAEFRYLTDDGVIASFPIAVDMRLKAGDDICKKLITNARSKALSWLGFSADVFMGKFDDAAYVKDLKVEYAEHEATRNTALSQIRTAKTADDLAKLSEKIGHYVANGRIDWDLGAELFDEVGKRREALASKTSSPA